MSTLYVIGAGPGDPDLITLKAIKILRKADVILYDSLANEELLNFAPSARRLFVGKRKGYKAFTQDEINQKIVDLSARYSTIVRLKGGDPFVFGRGFEEMAYAKKHGINAEYIPGISSAIGAVGMAGIPATHRDLSRSFWVITATTSDGSLSKDVYFAAQSDATLIVLMGLSKLNEIVQLFKQFGKADLPVAVIQNGTLPNQKVAVGNVETIQKAVLEVGIGSPALLVFGQVAGFAVSTIVSTLPKQVYLEAV